MTEPRLRLAQKQILDYREGLMGVSAVPGSGKTWTLSRLAVQLILASDLAPDQEVLVVTFSNSAADNFSLRIGELLQEYGLLPDVGYRVRTLHGLANDIIRERPDLVGLSEEFSIIDEKEASLVLDSAIALTEEAFPQHFEQYLDPGLSERKRAEVLKGALPALIRNLATAYIRTAKDELLNVALLEEMFAANPAADKSLQYLQKVFQAYQASLAYRGAVDFDDLICYAHSCLAADPSLVSLLQYRWPFILEDEAQDSSKLQESILRKLVGKQGNWVRVGDPNQAIYESFTTADPNLLKRFVNHPATRQQTLPQSGRSAREILELANELNRWACESHENPAINDALAPPYILPTDADDPQPNPEGIVPVTDLVMQRFTPEQELNYIVKQAKAWLEKYPNQNLAVLAFYNDRVAEFSDAFRKQGVPVAEGLLSLPQNTRLSAGAIANLLISLFHPGNSKALANAYAVVHRRDSTEKSERNQAAIQLLRDCPDLEEYLYPLGARDYLVQLKEQGQAAETLQDLIEFKDLITRWHLARQLPLDQLVLTLSQDLSLDHYETATIYQLASLLRELSRAHPEWTPLDINQELIQIAKNRRRFVAFSENESGYDPNNHLGAVTVATIHKSKGLEWDKVFLTSVNDYDFPSGSDTEIYQAERYFLEDSRNLEAELLDKLRKLIAFSKNQAIHEADPAYEHRQQIARERLRLLYVGITRAKRSITLTWNTGKLRRSWPAKALEHLNCFLENQDA